MSSFNLLQWSFGKLTEQPIDVPTLKIKTNGTTRTSSALTDDTSLSGFVVDSGSYLLEAKIKASFGSAAQALTIRFSTGASFEGEYTALTFPSINTQVVDYLYENVSNNDLVIPGLANETLLITINLLVSSTSPSTLNLQWAPSDPSGVIFNKASWVRVSKSN